MHKKELGFFSVIAMVISLQLGSGLFMLPNQLAPYGMWGIFGWLVAGTGALALCLVFAKLSQHSAKAGGPHVYVKEAFGNRAAFYVGWSYWVISWLSAIPYLMLAISSLEDLMGVFSVSQRIGVTLFFLISLTWLNLRGAALAGIGEIIFTLLKILPIVIIAIISFSFWRSDYLLSPSNYPAFSSFNAASLLIFWAFLGFEGGTTLANNVKNASVVMPRALFWGTFFVALLSTLNVMAVFSVLPPDVLKTSVNTYSLFLAKLGGNPWYGKIASFLICIVCLGTLNSWILTCGQTVLIASQEKLFPSFFGKLNGYQSPQIGIIASALSLFVCTMLLQNKSIQQQLNELVNLSTIIFIVIYMMAVFSLIKLIHQKKISSSPVAWVSIGIGLLFCAWSIVTTQGIILLEMLIIPFSGLILSYLFKWPVR
jgi:APA family basic amino acid/polyamine antiporter